MGIQEDAADFARAEVEYEDPLRATMVEEGYTTYQAERRRTKMPDKIPTLGYKLPTWDKLKWYAKQLLPLTYRTTYKDDDGLTHFSVWRMWLGRHFDWDDEIIMTVDDYKKLAAYNRVQPFNGGEPCVIDVKVNLDEDDLIQQLRNIGAM